MNPQKKLLQLDLAKELMMAEVTGRRAHGVTDPLDYVKLYRMLVTKAEGIVNFMEEEATKNIQEFQAQQFENTPFNNSEVEDEKKQGRE
jgi:hypothetical protein